jgi:hypothetical protein
MVSRLGLRLDVVNWAFGVPGFLSVTILVDGEEIFASVGRRTYCGLGPVRMLDPDEPALLPAVPARRAPLYAFPSLYGPGEGCIAAVIEDRPGLVAWTGIRDYLGIHTDVPTALDTYAGAPEVLFDGGQYRDEVAGVMADPFWDTDQLRTLRLIRQHLNQATAYLAGLGWEFEDACTGRAGIWVLLRDQARNQLILELPEATGAPADRAAAVAGTVLSTPPLHWPVVHCSASDHHHGTGPNTTPRTHHPPARQGYRRPVARGTAPASTE